MTPLRDGMTEWQNTFSGTGPDEPRGCSTSEHSRRRAALRRAFACLLLLGSGGVALALIRPGSAPPAPPAPTETPGPGDGLELLCASPAIRFPRDVALDASGAAYVVDRTACVHKVGRDGGLIATFPLPVRDRGNPQGICVAPDGRILVADTHNARIAVLSEDGKFLSSFGRPGKGDGEFIYPVSVAVGPDGRIFVGEYGGEDRIQIFGPTGKWLYSFGSTGDEPGRLRRPSGMCFGPGGLLYVADACNHRIQAFDPDGSFRFAFGSFGSGPGMLHYPFDVAATPDDTLVVSEYGNHRLQEFGPRGEPLRRVGRAGDGGGALHCPWGVAAGPDGVVVSDTWNHRLQFWRRPAMPAQEAAVCAGAASSQRPVADKR